MNLEATVKYYAYRPLGKPKPLGLFRFFDGAQRPAEKLIRTTGWIPDDTIRAMFLSGEINDDDLVSEAEARAIAEEWGATLEIVPTVSSLVNDCFLDARIKELTAEHVTIWYGFENRGKRTVYVFNRHGVPDENGVFHIDPDAVSVEIESGLAVIGQKIVDAAPGADGGTPLVPCVTRVKAERRMEDQLSVSLPLRPVPARAGASETTAPGATSSLPACFELGFIVAPADGDEAGVKEVPSTMGPALRLETLKPSSQQLIRVGPLPDKLPIGGEPTGAPTA